MPKKYYIKTYGCQMNKNDSERLAGVLESFGYREEQGLVGMRRGEQGIILVNTCCVREHAENRAFGFISSLKNLKKQNPNLIIGVCGCIPKEDHIDLRAKFPFVDLIFGPNEPEKLARFLGSENGQPFPIKRLEKDVAWITIMQGCNNFCSYCIVPYVRGREVSRPIKDIVEEIKTASEQGYQDIFLLGQNVNSYQYGLANLLQIISGIKEVGRIRFMTSHPRDMSDEIINAVAELTKVDNFFHLPIQSGDDIILKMMNRGYTVDYYVKLVDKIRSLIPKAVITTDVIVGFPGETEEQFENTLNIIKKIKFNAVNMAAYSTRPQTAASKLPNQLPEEIKQARLQETIQVVRETVRCYNPRKEGE